VLIDGHLFYLPYLFSILLSSSLIDGYSSFLSFPLFSVGLRTRARSHISLPFGHVVLSVICLTHCFCSRLCLCRDSLLYKGSEDDDELGLEVTGWAWNKRTKTKTMMTATRMRVKGSMVAG
jgi:hypothetical protein